ncbi:uncharacterized protein LOC144094131 isoform X4 [Amblyomma americanum]
MSEYGQWITCTKLEDCEVIIENDGNGTFTSGYLKLTPSQHEEEKRLEVRVRGCNSYGCGKENHVEVHPHAIATAKQEKKAVTGMRRVFVSTTRSTSTIATAKQEKKAVTGMRSLRFQVKCLLFSSEEV